MSEEISNLAIKNFLDLSKVLELRDNDVVSHYTSVSALKGMLENLTFRASHVFYMNDPADGADLYDSVIFSIKKYLIGKRFDNQILEIEKKFGKIEVFNESDYSDVNSILVNDFSAEWLFQIFQHMFERKYIVSRGASSGYEDVYVVSFVKDSSEDLVNHWMSYGKDGFGVKIDFSIKPLFDGFNLYFSSVFSDDIMRGSTVYLGSCLYESSKQIANRAVNFVRSLVEMVSRGFDFENDKMILYKISRAIMEISALIKHKSYKNEDECRLLLSSLPIESGQVNYNVSGSLVQPYRLVGLNWDAIEKITCGPRSDFRSDHAITHLTENLRYHYIQEISKIIKDGRDEYFKSKWKRYMPPSRELNIVRSAVRYVGKES